MKANAIELDDNTDRWVRRLTLAVMVGVAAALTAVGALLYG